MITESTKEFMKGIVCFIFSMFMLSQTYNIFDIHYALGFMWIFGGIVLNLQAIVFMVRSFTIFVKTKEERE